jgi:toxin ParE1/3/4
MVEVIWTEPALDQLNDIAEYIATDNPAAAAQLVKRVFQSTDQLAHFPESGRQPPELPDSVYRELVISPCRLFYRCEHQKVFMLHVLRQERDVRRYIAEFRHG